MPQQSAGIVLVRHRGADAEVLLVHPGGPLWANKDDGAWSVPKGLFDAGEDPLTAAKREFCEETGCAEPADVVELGVFRLPSRKTLHIWTAEGDFDPAELASNLFTMEWPPRSGRRQQFPEVDRAAWFTPAQAMTKIVKGQQPVLLALWQRLGVSAE